MRRWRRSAVRAILIMLLDVVVYVAFGVTMGRHAPRWITMPLFWILAWPVSVFRHLFPHPAPGSHAPSIMAWLCGGIVDLIWVTLLVDGLWRPRTETAAPPPSIM